MRAHVSPLVRPHATLPSNLAERAERHGERIAVSFRTGDGAATELTYAGLWQRAAAVAELVRAARRREHDPQFVLIVLPNGLDYIASFHGCLLAGAVAVPFYPPAIMTSRAAQAFDQRIGQVLRDCRPSLVVLSADLVDQVRAAVDPDLRAATSWVVAEHLPAAPQDVESAVRIDARPVDLALLQYTSGSTMLPKGVMVTHRNLLHNTAMMRTAFGAVEGDAVTTWLPLYHDMGLIGMMLMPLSAGMTINLSTPPDFVRRPFGWLETMSRTATTVTMAPNFALDLCVRWVTEEERQSLDLSALRCLVVGAEPVRPTTIEAFTKSFEPCGLGSSVITPGYGMAEATLCVTATGGPHNPVLLEVSAARLREGVAQPPGDEPSTVIVGCGSDALPEIETVIVDPERVVPLPDGHVGEIWTTGPSVAEGYWGLPDVSDATFAAELPNDGRQFLRTGDLGLKVDGQLFIIGRIKDLIIQQGVNHYPQDLEYTAEQADPLVRLGGAVAFTVPAGDGEGLVVLCELLRYGKGVDGATIVRAVRRALTEQHGVELHAVAIVRKGQIPKTTSGKVRRRASAARWLDGQFETVEG
jgi:acyl-CoA synthetase (AMP-forming)/AMP-acid ligase II